MVSDDSPIKRRGFMALLGGAAGLSLATAASGEPDVHTIPGRIQAEDFADYYDFNEGNNGGVYRDTDVDLEEGTDEDGTPTVGWTWPTEVLTYAVDVTPGTYDIHLRAASWRDEGGALLFLGHRNIGHVTFLESTGIYDWKTTTLEDITLDESGANTLYIQFLGGSTNLNWIEFDELESSSDELGYGFGGYGQTDYGQ